MYRQKHVNAEKKLSSAAMIAQHLNEAILKTLAWNMLTLQSCSRKCQDTHCNFCSVLLVSGPSGACLAVPVL